MEIQIGFKGINEDIKKDIKMIIKILNDSENSNGTYTYL
jgi:hypothetical protein